MSESPWSAPPTLTQLEQLIRQAWSADTAWTPSEWNADRPAAGQCFSTAYVVQQLLGGTIVHAEVFPYHQPKQRHAWNRLPSGLELDLTREQFPSGQVLLPCELPEELVWRFGGQQASRLWATVRERLGWREGAPAAGVPAEPAAVPQPTLAAGAYLLRPFTPVDAEVFAKAVRESMDTVGRWMSWAHGSYSAAEALAWFSQCDHAWRTGTGCEFGIFDAETQDLVGGCGLNQFNQLNRFCNLGYWVRQSRQREGAARASVEALAAFGFSSLQFVRIEIIVASGNQPSLAVARACGAWHEGVARQRLVLHGRPVDAHVFSLVPHTAVTAAAEEKS